MRTDVLKSIGLIMAILVLSFVDTSQAQRSRPGTDVGAGDDTYVLASLKDNAIILYAIYSTASPHSIQSYILWNDTDSAAHVQMGFTAGDPIEMTALPGTRQSADVQLKGYAMAINPEEGALYDPNVQTHSLTHNEIFNVRERVNRSFPLPTQRGKVP